MICVSWLLLEVHSKGHSELTCRRSIWNGSGSRMMACATVRRLVQCYVVLRWLGYYNYGLDTHTLISANSNIRVCKTFLYLKIFIIYHLPCFITKIRKILKVLKANAVSLLFIRIYWFKYIIKLFLNKDIIYL